MKTIIRLALFFAFAIHLHLLLAAVPLRWTVETSRVQPAQLDAYHGETLDLEATFLSYGLPLALPPDADCRIFWQTNGMGNVYWSTNAVLVSSNAIAAAFQPTFDPGATTVLGFIGIPASNYRAAFTIRFRGSPGATPFNPPPFPMAEYYTKPEVDSRIGSATNAIRRVDGAARPLPPYLHALDFDDAYPEDAAWYYAQPQDYGHCSSVREGNSFARNYDWKFDRSSEFVVRMSAGPGRFASVGVANCGTNLTEEISTSGKWSRYYKCLPGRTVDGINENGVAVNVNVVSGDPSWQTGEGLHPLAAVRWVLDNAVSAASAAQHLAEHIRFPAGWTQNFHWMVADADETWIVENGAAHKVTGRAAMTNFPLYPSRGSGEGQERYDALMGDSNITSQWWTLTYTADGYRASDLPGIDSNLVFAAWASKPRESHRGETFGDVAWWQTVHTSVYDITNRTLRIAVQERDDWYVFSVPQGGKVKSVNGQTGDVVLAGEDVISDLATIRSGAAAGATAVQPSAIADMETQTHAAANYVPFANTTKTAVKIGGLNTAQSTDGGGTIAIGRNTRALADSSFAGGHRAMTAADTKYAFAFGNRNYAPTGATALGYQAWAASAGQFANDDSDVVTGLGQKHKYSFVWQGKDDSNPGYYHSHGDGTFNVNPIGGLAGFWIGSTSLQSLLNAKQPTITDLATIRSGAAAGATAVQPASISDMETQTHAAQTYQPKGQYLTSETDPTVSSAISTHNSSTSAHNDLRTSIAAKYSKPSGGIPKTDLASAVQTSLGKADSALQSAHNTSTTAHTDIRTAVANAQAHSEATRQIVSTWEGFLDGSNVVFSITNYISGTYSLDHAKLQIKELLPDANEYRIVYDSRIEITNHTAAAKREIVGYVDGVATELRGEIAEKGDKAWGRRSSTGQDVPISNTVWVTEQNLRIAGGMEYERVAVGEGAIYVLTSKGQTPYMIGDEGALMLKDDGGTNYFGMVRSDSYTIGCNTDGIRTQNNLVYLDYAVTMSDHPCIWYTESLEGDVVWEQLNLPDGSAVPGASHQVVWDESPRLGAQECYINCPEGSGFFRATIEVAGDARFRTNMPAEIPSFYCADNPDKKVKIIWNNGNPKFVEAN